MATWVQCVPENPPSRQLRGRFSKTHRSQVFPPRTVCFCRQPLLSLPPTKIVNYTHIAGGTTAGLFAGKSFEDAFNDSFEGLFQSMAIGGAVGVASTIAVSYANGVSPWTGRELGSYSVYKGVDPQTKETKYVGITRREPNIRFQEHLRSNTPRANLEYKIINQGVNYTEARIIEQTWINSYGLENLYNKINSISPKYWNQYNIKP